MSGVNEDNGIFSVLAVLVIGVAIILVVITLFAVSTGPFTTTTIGTVSQVQSYWGFTTINFVSTGQSITCWDLHPTPQVGAKIQVVRPAWTWFYCQVSA